MGELQIVPFLDVVINLIMFLLMVTTAASQWVQLDARLPSRGPLGTPVSSLSLSAHVDEDGVHVLGAEPAWLASTCGEPLHFAFDERDALRTCLGQVRERARGWFEDGDRIILSADPRVPYENFVATLDALQSDGPYEDVLVSAGLR